MTKKEAIQDAEARMKRTGLVWMAILIRHNRWWVNLYRWVTNTRLFDTVSEHHKEQHEGLYKSGHFKIINTFTPDTESELDLSYLNLDRKARRKLERKLKTK